ncbi:hypothetical protein AOQ84DRAFT_134774 [Glonium stellatum]|uniref:Uncharacterized protein n=1 Tax=Glonium stellatum TaxID=574774 RepID=A0A8E2JNJ0_9PEZI|nr:hypothetical protein AOQ84DRAFT_134774 [Glonium stellatum]
MGFPPPSPALFACLPTRHLTAPRAPSRYNPRSCVCVPFTCNLQSTSHHRRRHRHSQQPVRHVRETQFEIMVNVK